VRWLFLSQFWSLLKGASFLGSWGNSKNWLWLKIEPLVAYLNRWNTLYKLWLNNQWKSWWRFLPIIVCSPYFRHMLTSAPANRFPIIFLNDVHPTDFERLLQVRFIKINLPTCKYSQIRLKRTARDRPFLFVITGSIYLLI
jgi:hypothetical protein